MFIAAKSLPTLQEQCLSVPACYSLRTQTSNSCSVVHLHCPSNLVQACKLKLGDLKGALLDADLALRESEGNAKAFFRQGQVGIDLQ